MENDRLIVTMINTISSYLRNIVNVGVFLFLTPYVAGKLGTETFGLWSLLWSTVGLFALFDLGFSPSVVKYLADARGRGDHTRLGHLTATFFWLHMGLGSMALCAALLFVPVLSPALDIPQHLEDSASIVFLLLAFRIAQSMPLGLFASILVAFQKEAWANCIKILGTLSYGMVVYLVFEQLPTIENIAYVNLGSAIAANLVMVVICIRKFEGVRIAPKWFKKSLLRDITSFSVYALVLYASQLLYTRVDAIIIQKYHSLVQVAFYNIAMQTVDRAGHLTGLLNKTLTPTIAELKGSGDHEAIRQIYQKSTKLSFALAIPLLVGLIWFTDPLLLAWMGKEFLPAVIPMQILTAAMIANALNGGARAVLLMTGHHRFMTIVVVLGQLLNLTLTLIVVEDYGLPGVATATFVSVLVSNLVLIWFACKIYSFPFLLFLVKAIKPAAIPFICMLAVLYCIELWATPSSIYFIALLEALVCAVFFGTYYMFGLNGDERSYFLNGIKQIKSKGK